MDGLLLTLFCAPAQQYDQLLAVFT